MTNVVSGTTSSNAWEFRLYLEVESTDRETYLRIVPQIRRNPINNNSYVHGNITVSIWLANADLNPNNAMHHQYTVAQPNMAVGSVYWLNLQLPSGWDTTDNSVRFPLTQAGQGIRMSCAVTTDFNPQTMTVTDTCVVCNNIAPPVTGSAPDTPTGVVVTGTYDNATVSWNAAARADRYCIQMAQSVKPNAALTDWTDVLTVEGGQTTQATIAISNPTLVGGSTYFSVRANNGYGNSGQSVPVSICRTGGAVINKTNKGTAYVKVNGTWHQQKYIWIKSNGTWVKSKS